MKKPINSSGLLFVVAFFLSQSISGQDKLFFDQFMFHPQLINPAAIGQNGDFGAFAYGYNDLGKAIEPEFTYLLSAYTRSVENKIGFGINAKYDGFWMEDFLQVSTDFSYNWNFNSESSLNIGIRGGYFNYKNPLTEYEVFDEHDPLLANDLVKNYLKFGLGIHFSTNTFFAGISSPQTLTFDLTDNSEEADNYIYTPFPDRLYFMSGYKIKVVEKFDVQPIVLLSPILDGSDEPFFYHASINFHYDDKLWVGASYQYRKTFAVHARWKFKNGIGIGYSCVFRNIMESGNYKFPTEHGLSLSYELVKL